MPLLCKLIILVLVKQYFFQIKINLVKVIVKVSWIVDSLASIFNPSYIMVCVGFNTDFSSLIVTPSVRAYQLDCSSQFCQVVIKEEPVILVSNSLNSGCQSDFLEARRSKKLEERSR